MNNQFTDVLLESTEVIVNFSGEDADALGSAYVQMKKTVEKICGDLDDSLTEITSSMEHLSTDKEAITGLFYPKKFIFTYPEVIGYERLYRRAKANFINNKAEGIEFVRKELISAVGFASIADGGFDGIVEAFANKKTALMYTQYELGHVRNSLQSHIWAFMNKLRILAEEVYDFREEDSCDSMSYSVDIFNVFVSFTKAIAKIYADAYDSFYKAIHKDDVLEPQYVTNLKTETKKRDECKIALAKAIDTQDKYTATHDQPNAELAKVADTLTEKYQTFCSNVENLTEEVEEKTAKTVAEYVDIMNKCVEDIREFTNNFKYKEFIESRRKHIDRMDDYLRGALERNYKLKIPMYTINVGGEKANEIAKEYVEFLNKMVDEKYDAFHVLCVNAEDNGEWLIYLTLREPHKVEGKEDTKNETCNEDAISTDERKTLPDNVFGIPEIRAYPLTDEEHIRRAIQLFFHAKSQYRDTLAKNITRRTIELKLVGKVTIGTDNAFKKKFPEWMWAESKATMKVDGNTYQIFIGDKEVKHGVLPSTKKDEDDTINESIVFDANGNTYL